MKSACGHDLSPAFSSVYLSSQDMPAFVFIKYTLALIRVCSNQSIYTRETSTQSTGEIQDTRKKYKLCLLYISYSHVLQENSTVPKAKWKLFNPIFNQRKFLVWTNCLQEFKRISRNVKHARFTFDGRIYSTFTANVKLQLTLTLNYRDCTRHLRDRNTLNLNS